MARRSLKFSDEVLSLTLFSEKSKTFCRLHEFIRVNDPGQGF